MGAAGLRFLASDQVAQYPEWGAVIRYPAGDAAVIELAGFCLQFRQSIST
jgi:hypothetical protein